MAHFIINMESNKKQKISHNVCEIINPYNDPCSICFTQVKKVVKTCTCGFYMCCTCLYKYAKTNLCKCLGNNKEHMHFLEGQSIRSIILKLKKQDAKDIQEFTNAILIFRNHTRDRKSLKNKALSLRYQMELDDREERKQYELVDEYNNKSIIRRCIRFIWNYFKFIKNLKK